MSNKNDGVVEGAVFTKPTAYCTEKIDAVTNQDRLCAPTQEFKNTINKKYEKNKKKAEQIIKKASSVDLCEHNLTKTNGCGTPNSNKGLTSLPAYTGMSEKEQGDYKGLKCEKGARIGFGCDLKKSSKDCGANDKCEWETCDFSNSKFGRVGGTNTLDLSPISMADRWIGCLQGKEFDKFGDNEQLKKDLITAQGTDAVLYDASARSEFSPGAKNNAAMQAPELKNRHAWSDKTIQALPEDWKDSVKEFKE